jgi:hypothetical protein
MAKTNYLMWIILNINNSFCSSSIKYFGTENEKT